MIPLAALDVSLEQQIDQLLLLLNDPALTSSKLPASLNEQLNNARKEVGTDNGVGSLEAARSHLRNFINDVQHLIEKGDIAPDKGKPLLDGAAAILEQIEGNHPPKHSVDDGNPPESDLGSWSRLRGSDRPDNFE